MRKQRFRTSAWLLNRKKKSLATPTRSPALRHQRCHPCMQPSINNIILTCHLGTYGVSRLLLKSTQDYTPQPWFLPLIPHLRLGRRTTVAAPLLHVQGRGTALVVRLPHYSPPPKTATCTAMLLIIIFIKTGQLHHVAHGAMSTISILRRLFQQALESHNVITYVRNEGTQNWC